MKKILLFISIFFIFQIANAQTIQIHNGGYVIYANPTSTVDSIKLDNTYAKYNTAGNATGLKIAKSFIDSMTFTNNTITLDKIYIIYNGTDNATIINPYATQGVAITANGGAVTVTGTSGISNLEYNLLGTSAVGSLTMSSTTPATFVMNNLNITNTTGVVISVSGGQTHTFTSKAGSSNFLTDGSGNTKNGTLNTDGKIILNGTGTLTLKGVKRHGINTSSLIEVQSSTVIVTSAASDGLHSEGFTMSGGTVSVLASTSDGIDAGDVAVDISGGTINITSTANDVKAIKTGNGTITIANAVLNLNVSGKASKAISSKKVITINSGTLNISLSGDVILAASGSGFNPSYCTAVKSDLQIYINGGIFTIDVAASAKGGKVFSANSDIVITDGTFNITTAGANGSYVNTLGANASYNTTAFSSDLNTIISGGTFTLSNTAIDGKQFSVNGSISVSGGTINITNSGDYGKAFKADGTVTFSGGNTNITLSGATVLIASGAGFDPSYPTGVKAAGLITVNTGTAISITGASTATGAKGLSSDMGIIINGGSITTNLAGDGANYTNQLGITDSYSAAGLSCDDDITIGGGVLNLTNSGADGKNVSADTSIYVTGGNLVFVNSGAAGKGFKADGNISFTGGNTSVSLTGATVLAASGSGFDPSYPTGAKATGTISVSTDATISVTGTMAATGAKGLSANGAITVNGGKITTNLAGAGANYTNPLGVADAYSAAGLSSDNAITIAGGTHSLTNSGADGKNINSDTNIFVSGGTVTITNSGAAGKGLKADGNISFTGGTTNISLSGATVLAASGSGFDPSYPTGAKATGTITVSADATISVTGTLAATGAKGFSSDKSITVDGGKITTNLAGVGANYTNPLGIADAYSSASLGADANISISGGTLNLTNSGKDSKCINADTSVFINGGTISITNSGAYGKGVKADISIVIGGGTTNVNLSGATNLIASGSGFDPSYPSGLKSTGTITINSGNVTVTGTSTATGTKGISADSHITINGGTISVTKAGNGATYTSPNGTINSYSSAAITTDANLVINAGNITTSSSGTGGKGLKADGILTIGTASLSPTLNITTTGARFLVSGSGSTADYNHPKAIVTTGAITITNGTLTINSTDDGIHSDASITIAGGTNKVTSVSTTAGVGEGIESPIINFTGGVTTVHASNDGINTTYGTVTGGTNSYDGSQLNISGGIIIASGSDAIDSNGNITITGGTTIVCGPTAGPEEGIDVNGTLVIHGGYLISAGSNSNMTPNFNAASTQPNMFIKSAAQLPVTSLIHIRNASGTEMVTFKPKNAVYYLHFSSASVAAGTSYSIYSGGTYTGGSLVGGATTWGLYTGGTYNTTGATLKKTFTTSTTTTINTVTF